MKLNTGKIFEKIEKLSKLHRILICVVSIVIPLGLFIWLSYLPKHETIGELTEKLETLEQELVIAKKKASQLKKVEKQMAEAQAKFEVAKKALPESEEIPSLLNNVANVRQDSGLESILFEPQKEIGKGFYAEIPINIKVVGEYHQMVSFSNKVARLNRIVNLKDVVIEPVEERSRKKGEEMPTGNALSISCTAVTYKFLDKPPEESVD